MEFQKGSLINRTWLVLGSTEGGMGRVYTVLDCRDGLTIYALKTFKAPVLEAWKRASDRFRREAKAWIGLPPHPNVVKAVLIEDIEGTPHLLLEYVPGGTLSGLIQAGSLTKNPRLAARLGLQVCRGMVHARKNGVAVHRDLKPDNCLLAADDRLKISDFGLAKAFDELPNGQLSLFTSMGDPSRSANPSLTATGVAAGTPYYMSPEQFRDAKHVDVRSDIYAFGVILFEMLCGVRPFQASSLRELERLHKEFLVELPVEIPRKLAAITTRCLAKEPSKRFASFEELGKALEAAYAEVFREAPPPEESEVEADDQVPRLINQGASLVVVGEVKKALELLERAVGLAPTERIAWLNFGRALVAAGRHADGIAAYEKAIQLDNSYALAWANKGAALAETGRHAEALDAMDHALRLDSRDPMLYCNRGICLEALDRRRDAEESYTRAIELNPSSFRAWANRAANLIALDRVKEGLEAASRALDINPRSVAALVNKANALFRLGDHVAALQHVDKALELDPSRPEAYSARALILINGLGRLGEGLLALFEARRKSSPTADGITKEIAELVAKSEAAFTQDGAAQSVMASLSVDDFEQARDKLKTLIERFPAHPHLWIMDMILANQLGDKSGCERSFNFADELDPEATGAALAKLTKAR